MRFLLISCLLCFISHAADANQAEDVSEEHSRLHQLCGYKMGESIVSRVVNVNLKEGEMSTAIRFRIDIFGKNRKLPATLEFGCRKSNFQSPSSSDAAGPMSGDQEMTAKEVIASEDSGGRYYRIISWQREYRGVDFSGTVAHVNRIFGDGVAMPVPDFYFACPKKSGLTCYSVEVDPNVRLTKAERMDVMDIIKNIGYSH